MSVRKSRYNHLFKKEDKSFLYNSLTNSFALIDDDLFEILSEKSKNVISIDKLDTDTLALLRKMKAVDVDDDTEIKKLRYYTLSQRFNPYSLSLTINPTLGCNFACPYCFEASHEAVFMDDRTENGIIDYIKKTKARNLFVTWFGGEPLLAFDRIRSLSEKIFDLDINYHSGMITNGYLLSEDIINDLEKLRIGSL